MNEKVCKIFQNVVCSFLPSILSVNWTMLNSLSRLVNTMLGLPKQKATSSNSKIAEYPASILYKSIAGRYRPVSYPDGPITAHYRFTGYDTIPCAFLTHEPRHAKTCPRACADQPAHQWIIQNVRNKSKMS